MKKRLTFFLIVICTLAVVASACSPKTVVEPTIATGAPDQPASTILDGKSLLESRCTECHDLTRVTTKTKTLEEWQTTVSRMVNNGAVLSAEEQTLLVEYLAETYK